MKKSFVILCLMATGIFSANAQDATTTTTTTTTTSSGPIMSKRGYPILPQGGDWSVSFNATPFLNYVGNVFNNSIGNTVAAAFPSSFNAVTLRKFTDDNTAFRALVRFDLGTKTNKYSVQDDAAVLANPNSTATVEDKVVVKNSDILIGGGLEKRKGVGRVQGIYGAMAAINFGRGSSGTTKYTYGNAFNATTGDATINIGSGATTVTSRTTESKNSTGFGVGVVGFVGAEYFIAPKLSLGAEFQWGPSVQFGGKSSVTTESISGGKITTKTTETPGNSGLNLNTSVTYINLNFFF